MGRFVQIAVALGEDGAVKGLGPNKGYSAEPFGPGPFPSVT